MVPEGFERLPRNRKLVFLRSRPSEISHPLLDYLLSEEQVQQ